VADVDEREALAEWRTTAPGLVAALVQEWALRVDGTPTAGATASVLPVRTSTGEAAVLKVGWPHWEAEHEHLALRAWAGDGTVRLLRADPRRFALLLERAEPGHDLSGVPVVDACEVVAGLYRRLHRPALPQLTRLSEHAARWAGSLAELRTMDQVPRRFVDQARGLARSFADDPATDGSLLHTDLHYGNVLAAGREPWLVIDPKPMSGDPAYEVAPMLWNRWDEAVAGGDPRAATLERLFTLVDVAGLDEDRVRAWVVVRMMVNAWWAITSGAADVPTWLTLAVTLVKAVQR
jgi:streptomycin 6-kinase